MSNQCKHGINRDQCCECNKHYLEMAEAYRRHKNTNIGACVIRPFVDNAHLLDEAIDGLKEIDSHDCTEEVYETIEAAIVDLRTYRDWRLGNG